MIDNKKVLKLLCNMADNYEEKKEELSKYDAVIGDGDHGFSLARGNKAGKAKILSLNEDSSISDYFRNFGRELTCEIGGAMGPLFGLLFTEIDVAASGKNELTLVEIADGLEKAASLITELGGAKVGDKTMVDGIAPTVETLKMCVKENLSFLDGMEKALNSAEVGLKSTIELQAKRGRSKYLREKSIGYQDAGATSFYYFIKVIRDFVKEDSK